MLTSGLIASFIGPQIFISAKDALAPIPLAGGYGAIVVLSLVGAIPLLFLRIPVPAQRPASGSTSRFASLAVLRQIPVLKAVLIGVLIGAISQGVMMFMMVPTTLVMIGCGFSEAVAGDVIRWHFIAMFAPSFITGFLIKRFGTRPIVSIGLFFLALAAVTGASGLAAEQFYGSLILLGLGWNFSFIGATTMLTETVPDEDKSVAQGVNDTRTGRQ